MSMHSLFVYSVVNPSGAVINIALTRGPFGWDFMPIIANTHMHSLLDDLASIAAQHYIYVDDLLNHANSMLLCDIIAEIARRRLQKEGFLIHKPGTDKSSKTPETSTHFVGKNIVSGLNFSISNNHNTNMTSLIYAVIGTAQKVGSAAIQCIAGAIN